MFDVPRPQSLALGSMQLTCAVNLEDAIADKERRARFGTDEAFSSVLQILQNAAVAHYGGEYDIRVSLDKDGNASTAQVLTVVKKVKNPNQQVSLENSHRHRMNVKLGGEIINVLPTHIPDCLMPFVQEPASYSIRNIGLSTEKQAHPNHAS